MPPPPIPFHNPSEPFPPLDLHPLNAPPTTSRQPADPPGIPSDAWQPEDIDRRGELDDLNPVAGPSHAPSYRIYRGGEADIRPPWRQRRSSGGDPRPSGSTDRNSGISIETDSLYPPRNTSSAPPPREPSTSSSTTAASAMANPTRLTPYFSLEEILGAIRSRTSSPIDPSTSLRSRSPRPRPQSYPDRYRPGDLWAGLSSSFDPTRMLRSETPDSEDGDGGNLTPGSLSRRRPQSQRNLNVERNVETTANGNGNPGLTRPAAAITNAARARAIRRGASGAGASSRTLYPAQIRRPVMRGDDGLNAVDPEDILRYYPEDQSTDEERAEEEDDEDDQIEANSTDYTWRPVSGLSRDSMYSLGRNSTTDDVTVQGGSGGMSLRRGGNNRRRRSLLERLETVSANLRPGSTDTLALERDQSQLHAQRRNPNRGLVPTNLSRSASLPAIIVRSGESRKREAEDHPQSSRKRKREDTGTGASNQEENKPAIQYPTRPVFLDFTTLDPTTPIPLDFDLPTNKRIELTRHTSPGNPPRPCVTFTYQLPHRHDDDKHAAALRADRPIPVNCGIHYYEVEVLDQGEEGFISVGWMKSDTKLDRLVGWDTGSWGWHADDGRSFEGQGTGEPFGETWGKGDVVGCGLDFIKKQAFFTKNGRMIGYRFKNMGKGLHPAVGLRTTGESLSVNFTGPFKYDIDNHVRNLRDTIWRDALREDESREVGIPRLTDEAPKPLSPSERREGPSSNGNLEEKEDVDQPQGEKSTGVDVNGDVELPKLSNLRDTKAMINASFVLDYLRHEGHESALSLVKSDMRQRKWIPETLPGARTGLASAMGAGSSSLSEDDANRSLENFATVEGALRWLHGRIVNCHEDPIPWRLVIAFDPPSRLVNRLRMHEFYPYLLKSWESHRNAEGKAEGEGGGEVSDEDMEVIRVGQELRRQSFEEKWEDNEMKLLQEAMGLMGVVDLSQWEEIQLKAGVFSEARRKADADELMEYIKRARGMRDHSRLEQAFRQTHAINRRLAVKDPRAAFVDVRRILHERQNEGPSEAKRGSGEGGEGKQVKAEGEKAGEETTV